MSIKQSIEYAKSSWSALLKKPTVWGKPIHLTIEPTNICNLACPVCETGARVLRRPQGFMTLQDFRAIIDKVAGYTNTVFLYFMGEPFLHKQIYDIIAYATERGIFVSMCTNGEFVDSKKTIESRLGEISFQIGGITPLTHEVYRVGANFNRMWDNLLNTIEANKQSGNKTKIKVGFIVMKHNEHQVDDFLSIANNIGVIPEVISPCVRTIEQAKELLPENDAYWLYNKRALDNGILCPRNIVNGCLWIYYSAVVLWNGDVVPCCRDAHGVHIMGNLLRQDTDEIWNGKPYREFRNMVANNRKGMAICRLCSGFGVPRLN